MNTISTATYSQKALEKDEFRTHLKYAIICWICTIGILGYLLYAIIFKSTGKGIDANTLYCCWTVSGLCGMSAICLTVKTIIEKKRLDRINSTEGKLKLAAEQQEKLVRYSPFE